MSVLFIAGAGTDVGKTYVTEGLVRARRSQGRVVRALKPVASGAPDVDDPGFLATDTARLLRALGHPIDRAAADACSPYRYRAPLSPDMAAAAEGRGLALAELLEWTRRARAAAQADGAELLIEGVGGVMSPICDDATNLDFIAALSCPILLVTGSYLGAISHALTGLEAARARAVKVAALVVSETEASSVDFEATLATLRRFARDVAIAPLPRGGTIDPDAFN